MCTSSLLKGLADREIKVLEFVIFFRLNSVTKWRIYVNVKLKPVLLPQK